MYVCSNWFQHAKEARQQEGGGCGKFGFYYNNTFKVAARGGRSVEGGNSLVETTGSLTQTGVSMLVKSSLS